MRRVGATAPAMVDALVTIPVSGTSVTAAVGIDFESWYLREHPKVIAALTWVSGDPDVAAEATDEAFVRALGDWGRVEKMSSPGGWVYRVALNVVRRRMRRAAFERRKLEPPPAVAKEVDREIWAVVQQLPERQRVAVVLRYLLDLSEQDVAAAMGVSRGTVASALAAARRRLATWLTEEEESDE